jgi:hypothetical protein
LPRGLRIDEVPVLLGHPRGWAALAAKPIITSQVAEIHGNHYFNFLGLCDRAQNQEFSTRIVEPVRAKGPEGRG